MLLNDGVRNHPKVLAVGAEAAWLWAAAIDYCREQLTDGFVPTIALPGLGRFKTPVSKLATACLTAGLFDAAPQGIRVHDFLAHNGCKATVQQKRSDSKARQQAYRDRRAGTSRRAVEAVAVDASPAPLRNALRNALTPITSIDVDGDVGVDQISETTSWLAAHFWELWCEIAHRAGARQPLIATPKESEHVRVLLESYTEVELRQCLRIWWESSFTSGRNVGMFRSQMGEVLEHIASGVTTPFRGPKPKGSEPMAFDPQAWASGAAARKVMP